jgi:hypothetical protein
MSLSDLRNAYYLPSPLHSVWFHHSNNIYCREQIMKFLPAVYSTATWHFDPLTTKYSPQDTHFKHRHIYVHILLRKIIFRPMSVYDWRYYEERRLRSVLRLLVNANVVPSPPIIVTLMIQGIHFSETSVIIRATRRTSYKMALFIVTAVSTSNLT